MSGKGAVENHPDLYKITVDRSNKLPVMLIQERLYIIELSAGIYPMPTKSPASHSHCVMMPC